MSSDHEVSRYLSPKEKVLHTFRKHPFVLISTFIWWLIVLAGAAAAGFIISPRQSGSLADTIAGVVVIAMTGLVLWRLLSWSKYRYVITDQRVMSISGVVARRVRSVPIVKITDSVYERSFGGRIFGYGDLRLETTGEQTTTTQLARIPRPDEVYRLLTGLLLQRPGERGVSVGASSADETKLIRRGADETVRLPRLR